MRGIGPLKRLQEGEHYILLSFENGSIDATVLFGMNLDNLHQSTSLLKIAALQEHPLGMWKYGQRLFDGINGIKNENLGFQLMLNAAICGDSFYAKAGVECSLKGIKGFSNDPQLIGQFQSIISQNEKSDLSLLMEIAKETIL
jgi:TPR repeat protein